ncbi:MAG: DNA (cytosine-5-)-methyltransferase [Hyphomicrobiales bacterium]|nr:MAG: DNA (cytosine-5-)-methyltransferase [Hyphomicrobiales bacterium]
MSHALNYFSTFSGIGGFEAAIQSVDSKAVCVGYSEINKYADKIYRRHFPSHFNYGDIKTIDPASLPGFDLLIGGFPCQAFSTAGKRGGFDDTRGTLFFEVARIVREKQPRLLLLENVKGLLSHDKGRTFATIITTLDELGYDCQWQVLNSKNHSVPQNRERVFIIGHLRGTPRPEIFPLQEYANPLIAKSGKQASNAVVSGTLTATDAKMHLDGNYVIPVLTPDRARKRQNGRRFKTDGEPSFTLTAQDKHGIYAKSCIRRFTHTECERLQGFPDGWTEGISDTQRYKCLGNAVTVTVIQAILPRLLFTSHKRPD